MHHRHSLLALAVLVAACAEPTTTPSTRMSPRTPARSLVAAAPITLGSGLTNVSGRDPSNSLIACTGATSTGVALTTAGPACPSGALPMAAFVVPKHSAYVAALPGTAYIAQVSNGTTAPAPGFACCTMATFENTFTLPANTVSASITISMIADNAGSASINGAAIGAQNPAACNFCVPATTFTLNFTPDPSGTNKLDVQLWDGGGALGLDYSATVNYTINVDDTPPVITPTITGTLGGNGWYTSNVNLSWSVTDPDSPVSSSTGCAAASVTSDTDGQTFTCSATSSGGTASQSVTIKRDATRPTVAYSGNAGSYTVDQAVAITCAAGDATNPGSGLASTTCQNISAPAYTFAVGANTVSAAAVDHAGNTGNGSTSFNVSVTYGSLCALTQQFVVSKNGDSKGEGDDHGDTHGDSHAGDDTGDGGGDGIAHSLCEKLQHAQDAAAHGKTKEAAEQVKAYLNEVRAQAGKAIPTDKAAILAALAGKL